MRFAYEWHDDAGQWFRSYGNENWEFDEAGYMRGGSPASTTCPSRRASASFTGRRDDARTIIPDCPNSVCEHVSPFGVTR